MNKKTKNTEYNNVKRRKNYTLHSTLYTLKTVFVVLLLASCSSLRKAPTTEIAPLSSAEEQRFYYFYHEAVRLSSIRQLDQALETFLLAYSIAPNKAGLNSDLGVLYALIGFFDESERHLRKAVALQPQNWWFNVQLINLLAELQKFDDAIQIVLALQQHFPYREDVYFMLASLYTQTREFELAIDAYNQMERIIGTSEALSFEKIRLYMRAGMPERGIAEIHRLIEEFPAETRFRVLLGDFYMQLNQPENARAVFEQVLIDDPQNPFVYISLSEYYISRNQPEKAFELIVGALRSEHLGIDTKLDILGTHIESLIDNDKKIDEIEDLFKLLIEHYPLEEQVHAYYAVFLIFQDRQEDLKPVLKTITYINPQNEAAWFQMAQPYLIERDYETAIEILARAIENNPETPGFYFSKSIAQMLLEKYEDAAETVQIGIDLFESGQATSNRALHSELYTHLGDILNRLERTEESFEAYERAIEINPNNARALNNYAYSLALARKNLRKAERMSLRALELDPRNSAYLDTYAWILFKEGHYTLALFYIRRAVDNLQEGEERGIIFDHYGDILYRTGNKEKALEMWKKALEFGLECETLNMKIETGTLPDDNDEK